MSIDDFRGIGVVAGYGAAEVLRSVDFCVRRGEVVAVLGANGAGKSTLARTIGGLVAIRAGQLIVDGAAVHGLRADLRVTAGVAVVPEGRLLFPNLDIAETLQVGAIRASRAARHAAFSDVLELFPELQVRLGQLVGSLSGGQQQMLAIARALMSRPRYLVLDEPSLGLAPIVIARILGKVRDLAAEGVGVLLIEQNASLALDISDRALVMERGAVVTTGTADEVRNDPAVVHAYLGGRGRAGIAQQSQTGQADNEGDNT